jgi:hypothetical protein
MERIGRSIRYQTSIYSELKRACAGDDVTLDAQDSDPCVQIRGLVSRTIGNVRLMISAASRHNLVVNVGKGIRVCCTMAATNV